MKHRLDGIETMSNIRLKTEIPGPNSRALTARRLQAIPRGVYASTPLFVRHAEGATLEDVDGNRFIDLGGGIGCANVGHRNPRVLRALRAQLDAFLHLCFQVTGYESYVLLAEKLNQLTPGNFAKKTFLVNSGAESVENAVKIARAFTGRPAVISVEDGFHGRTMMGLSLTSKTHPYKEGFGPFLSDVYRIPYGVPANARLSNRGPMTTGQVNELLDQTFRRVVAAARHCLATAVYLCRRRSRRGRHAGHRVCRRRRSALCPSREKTGAALSATRRPGVDRGHV
jgi:4-aminobutyrate aminotransferase/(S)-3-amino-2-methylpropionate transaminase